MTPEEVTKLVELAREMVATLDHWGAVRLPEGRRKDAVSILRLLMADKNARDHWEDVLEGQYSQQRVPRPYDALGFSYDQVPDTSFDNASDDEIALFIMNPSRVLDVRAKRRIDPRGL